MYRAAISLFVLFLLTLPKASSGQCSNDSSTRNVQLRILSWNIYMLPYPVIRTGQASRAKEIAAVLRNEDVDIIVFEEAFDKASRAILRQGLKSSFPYESGDPSRNCFWKTSSGVWILSKVPVEVLKRIYFREARGSDRLACKGAVLVQGRKGNYCFQVVGTHLQSDLKDKDVKDIRRTQYEQIRKELLEPYAQENVPQFVVGDMNTMQHDSTSFSQMLHSLDMSYFDLEGQNCYSYDCHSNDLIINTYDQAQLIDYILYKPGVLSGIQGRMCVRVFKKQWQASHEDLSDHFAVSAVITLK